MALEYNRCVPVESQLQNITVAVNQIIEAGGTQNLFETVAVAGQSDVVADTPTDTLTLIAGSNITITTSAAGDSVTFAASGAAAGNAFGVIQVSGQSDVNADTTSDTLTLVAGANIVITTNAGTDTVTIDVTGVALLAFTTIAVSGQSNVVADSATDTLTLVAGSGITLTTNAGTDTITITASGGGSGLSAGCGIDGSALSGGDIVVLLDPAGFLECDETDGLAVTNEEVEITSLDPTGHTFSIIGDELILTLATTTYTLKVLSSDGGAGGSVQATFDTTECP